MKTIIIEQDIKTIYITAKSFPDGIVEAHQKLHSLVPFSLQRRYFGISRPEKGIIIYKAAVEELELGEATKLNCDTFVIPKGNYISIAIQNFASNPQNIEKTFMKLLSEPNLDPNGYCIEWYPNREDVICMVRLLESNC